MDELRAERKLHGLCVQCGAEMDRVGICCSRCNDRNNKSKIKRMVRLHSDKRCNDCTKPLDRAGWFCKSCVKKSNARARERNIELRALGLCIQCRQKTDGYTYCQRCRDQKMDRYWAKRGQIYGNNKL